MRPAPNAPPETTPTGLIPPQFQGNRFCNSLYCVVVAETQSDVVLVTSLKTDPRVELTLLPDAHKIYFAKSTFDIETGTFEKPFPGSTEVSPSSPIGLFVVVFKSYPRQAWLDELSRAGLSVLEALPPMGYQVYGSRATLAAMAAKSSYIYRFADIPAGVERADVDESVSAALDTPLATTVVAVGDVASLVKERLMALTGREPSEVYSTGSHLAFQADLTNAQAVALSRTPEVVWVHRNVSLPAPSDERFNRIVAGTWQSPLPSAWPTANTLGCNPPSQPCSPQPPYYWDSFLLSLQGIGIDTSRETIGFLDTGVDDALYHYDNGGVRCPPHLGTVGNCNLVFVTDVSTEFDLYGTPPLDLPKKRGDDLKEHGTITTSIAAGLSSGTNPRDTHGWSFTEGVAPGAKVAMSRHLIECREDGSGIRNDNSGTNLTAIPGLNYSLAELGTTGVLQDFPETPKPNGPGVRLFNHSWNRPAASGSDTSAYDEFSILLDQATRTLSSAKITMGPSPGTVITGDNVGSLHVFSAGNYPDSVGDPTLGRVTSPANAKNVITVGATSSLNDETYAPGSPCTFNQPGHADDTRNIESFSRFGYPNERMKPDLVAPGTRAYGRRSPRLKTEDTQWCFPGGCELCGCNLNLLNNQAQEFAWWAGTSFAAPVVSGAAALVHDWFRVLTGNPGSNASPALVKAALIASATNLRTTTDCQAPYLPAPDQHQGWGGVSLDRLFRDATNYYWYDQGTVFYEDAEGTIMSWSKTLTITDPLKPVAMALVWTDRASLPTAPSGLNLMNDLDLTVSTVSIPPGDLHYLRGNNYYYDRCDPARDGYSLLDPNKDLVFPDRKNNVERVDISPATIEQVGAMGFTIKVEGTHLRGDGLKPQCGTPPRACLLQQDFALFVVNAHE